MSLQAIAQDRAGQALTIALLKGMVEDFTSGHQSANDVLVHLKKINPSSYYIKIVHSDTSSAHKNGLDSTIFFTISTKDSMPILHTEYFYNNPFESKIHEEIFWYPRCGYSMLKGQIKFENGSLFKITLKSIQALFGIYISDPNNKYRKEENHYIFHYQSSLTQKKARIEITCVSPANSNVNFISCISLFFE